MTQINVCIANKQMHDKHKDQLPLPQALPGGLKAFYCTNFTLGPDIILNTKIHKKFGYTKTYNDIIYKILSTSWCTDTLTLTITQKFQFYQVNITVFRGLCLVRNKNSFNSMRIYRLT